MGAADAGPPWPSMSGTRAVKEQKWEDAKQSLCKLCTPAAPGAGRGSPHLSPTQGWDFFKIPNKFRSRFWLTKYSKKIIFDSRMGTLKINEVLQKHRKQRGNTFLEPLNSAQLLKTQRKTIQLVILPTRGEFRRMHFWDFSEAQGRGSKQFPSVKRGPHLTLGIQRNFHR